MAGDGPLAKTSKSKTYEMPSLVTWAQKDGLSHTGPCNREAKEENVACPGHTFLLAFHL